MLLPDATAFLNSLSVSDGQIPIESPDLVCFYVSDNQIPIATPAYASFSSQRRSNPDLLTGSCVLFLSAMVRS